MLIQYRGTNFRYFSLMALLLIFSNTAKAQLIPNVPRPQTAGEWAQVYTPVGEILGGDGIQPYTDAIDVKAPSDLVLLDDEILQRLNSAEPYGFHQIKLISEQLPAKAALVIQKLDLSAFQDKALTLADYHQLADKITAASVSQSLLCQIKISRDTSSEDAGASVLTVNLLPMKLGKIEVEGNKFLNASAIKHQVAVKSGQPISLKVIERKVRILQDNPDITGVSVELEPVDLTDTVNVRLKVEDKAPVHLAAFWNNLDQTYYGGQLNGISYVVNNATGRNDTFMATVLNDPRTHGVYTHYERPLNSHGTRFSMDFSNVRANPVGKGYDPYHMQGRMWNITTTISQVLVARENLRVSSDLNFDVRQAYTVSQYGALDGESWKNVTIERERLRDVRLGVQLQKSGDNYDLSMRHEATVAIPWMGGTPDSYRNVGNFGGGSQFFKYIGMFGFSRQLPKDTEAVLNGTFQWSPNTLPSPDLGGIGGTYFGRGYPEGLLQADSMVFTSAEFRTPFFIAPKSWNVPGTKDRIRDKVRFLTFADYGFAKNNDKTLVSDPTAHALSVGVGVRAEFSKYLSGRFDFGIPLLYQHEPINHYGPRIHFGLLAHVI